VLSKVDEGRREERKGLQRMRLYKPFIHQDTRRLRRGRISVIRTMELKGDWEDNEEDDNLSERLVSLKLELGQRFSVVPDVRRLDTPNVRNETPRNFVHELFAAVQHGDITTVEKLMAQGVKADCRNKKQETPLMRAALIGDVEICSVLKRYGADIEAENEMGRYPLAYALRMSQALVVEYLAMHGADVHAGLTKMGAIQIPSESVYHAFVRGKLKYRAVIISENVLTPYISKDVTSIVIDYLFKPDKSAYAFGGRDDHYETELQQLNKHDDD